MPAPWLAAALKAIPWSTLMSQAPSLIEQSRKLFTRIRSPAQPTPATTPDVLDQIRTRLDALEAHSQTQAELLRQIAEQMQRLTVGLEVVAARTRLALAAAVVALLTTAALWLWWLIR